MSTIAWQKWLRCAFSKIHLIVITNHTSLVLALWNRDTNKCIGNKTKNKILCPHLFCAKINCNPLEIPIALTEHPRIGQNIHLSQWSQLELQSLQCTAVSPYDNMSAEVLFYLRTTNQKPTLGLLQLLVKKKK